MEVTRKNFKETLPLISESIQKADFLTIDAEFTGLMYGRDVSIFDSPPEYYQRLYNGASDFLLIQYGLCAFYWDNQKKQYMNDAYNFYLFPRRPGPEKMFMCQSSSLDFLIAQGFDFNKLIKEGISYMSESTESRLREILTERQKNYSIEKDTITIPEQHKQQIAEICKKVRKFLDDKDSEEMEIDRCNNFVRRLLFQELAQFKEEVFVETKVLENQNRVLKVTRLKDGDNTKNRDNQKKEREWEEFEDAVGFSKVARMISQSGKLVIGHNMLLDILHTLNHFFQPIPEEYTSFKEFAHCMFPRLLDTKYMSSLPPFKDKINSSVLQHLIISLSENPFSLPIAESVEGRGYSRTDEKHHEAGYDAYVTGLCFLAMYGHLARMRGEGGARVSAADCALLKPFLNKLFLAKTAHQDSPYMNLAGPDPTPSRDHVFYMKFPKEWQRNDINQLFSPFGPVTVQFLDDVSAIVALSRREQARDVTRLLASHSSVSLVPYAKYKNQPNPKMHVENRRQTSPVKRAPATPEVRTPPADASTPQSGPRMTRSNSVSSPAPAPAQPTRKRTSSGVFQVDDAEPPPKKVEVEAKHSAESSINNSEVKHNADSSRKNAEAKHTADSTRKNSEVMSNGRRKADASRGDAGRHKDAKKVPVASVEKFDSEAKGNTVSAFKESDSWD